MELSFGRSQSLTQEQQLQQQMERQQQRDQEIEQSIPKLKQEAAGLFKSNEEVRSAVSRYTPEQQEALSSAVGEAAARAGARNPHITGIRVDEDNNIVGRVNKHYPFKTNIDQAVAAARRTDTPEEVVELPEITVVGKRRTPKEQEQNIWDRAGSWLDKNLADPVAESYRNHIKEPLAEAVKIEEDDWEITRSFKRGATAVGGAALSAVESAGEGIAETGRLAKEGASLLHDKAALGLDRHIDVLDDNEARAAQERTDSREQAIAQSWEHTKTTAQEYWNNPEQLKTDLSDGLESMKAGAERWQQAVDAADLHQAVEEGRPVTDIAGIALGGLGLAKGGISLSRKMAEAAAERARAETYRNNLQDIGEWGRNKNLAPESFVYQKLPDSLTRENLQFEEFKNLTRTHMDDITEEQVGQMKRIRDDVPPITRDTVVTKVMPYEYLEGYLKADNPYNTIGGFVTRKDDYGHLMGQNLENTYKHLALDYPDSAYTKALENGQDRYLVFEGRLTKPKQSAIPRGDKFGGSYDTPPPCTLNGFIACRSDEILPEYHVFGKDQYPEHGSTIWVVEDGVKRKAAVFNDEKMRFMIYDEKQDK